MEAYIVDSLSPQIAEAEESRIRAAYAKRQKNDARYSSFNRAHLFTVQERERQILSLLEQSGFALLETRKILEIGCGTGAWLREFIKWGARPENVWGVELLADRVAEARQVCPAPVTIQCRSATHLAFPDETFDLILQATVFTSILDSRTKQQIASEMCRVVKQEGLILWYDYHVNNPWNPDVRGVKKREIYELFPGYRIVLRRITPAPPLLRVIAPYSWMTCYLLSKIPWLCTHYLGVIRKG